jgi:hypothetical protein
MSAFLVALSGCEKQEGPAEHAGKAVENAVENAGQHTENAGDSVKDATTPDK